MNEDKDYKKIAGELFSLLENAVSHLDYCGYGDSWERECAQEEGLPDTLNKALEDYSFLKQE